MNFALVPLVVVVFMLHAHHKAQTALDFYVNKWRKNMKNIFKEFNGNFIVAERVVKFANGAVSKSVVGTMGWFYRDNMSKIELSSFSVASLHRKCGIGRQLIEYIHNMNGL